MTDSTDNTETTETTETTVERPVTLTVDVYNRPEQNLLELVLLADFIGFPISLYLPWGVVVGSLASPNVYYTHLAERTRSGISDPNLPEGWDKVLDDFASRHFDPYTNVKPSERSEANWYDGFDMTSHLIIQNARCWVGGSIASNDHEFLRVRISDVTAWAWGAPS